MRAYEKIKQLEVQKLASLKEIEGISKHPKSVKGCIDGLISKIKEQELQPTQPGYFQDLQKSKKGADRIIEFSIEMLYVNLKDPSALDVGGLIRLLDEYKTASDEINELNKKINELEKSN